MEVNSESPDLLNDRGSYQTSNHPVYYINTPLCKNKVSFFPVTQFPKIWSLKRETNFIIGGFMANQSWSPLILCFSFSSPSNHSSPKHPAF